MPEPKDELDQLRAENESLRSAPARRLRWRKLLTYVLVVLTSVSVVSASVAVWVHQVLFTTDRFTASIEPVLENPDFYVLIGDRASASVLEALAIETRLSEALESLDVYLSDTLLDALEVDETGRGILERLERPSLASLAPPIAGAVEARVDAGIHAFFSSEAFVSRFPEVVRQAHEVAVALARDDLADDPNVYVENGEVRLNLIPFIAEALRQVADEIRAVLPDFDPPAVVSDRIQEGKTQLETAVQASLPPDFGQVTLMSEAALTEIQDIAGPLDRYVWILVVASLVLLVLTMAVSPMRRRTALHLGLGVLVAVIVAAVIVRRIESTAVAELVGSGDTTVAGDTVRVALSGLKTVELLLAVAAIVVTVVAYLAGRPAWFQRTMTSLRAWMEPAEGGSRLDVWIAHHSGLLQVVGALAAAIALFAVGLGLVAVIIIGLLLTLYLWAVSAAARRVGAAKVTQS